MAKLTPPRIDKNAAANVKPAKTTDELIREYLAREANIDDQIETLRADKKTLKEQYKDRINLKVLAKAQRLAKLREKVEEAEETEFQHMLDLLDAELELRVAVRKAG